MEHTASPAQTEFCELACCTGFHLVEANKMCHWIHQMVADNTDKPHPNKTSHIR